MRKRTWVCGAVLALAALSGTARSAPVLPFPEISSALAAGKGAEALKLADTALSQAGLDSTDRARLLLDRGFAHQLQGDSDVALVDLTQAIEAHSLTTVQQSRAYLERGLILDGMNRLNDAIGDYGAVLRLDPGSATALNNRANAYRRQNRLDEARSDYLAALAADNVALEYPYYGLGQIAESLSKPDEAKDYYAKAIAANPGYSLAADRLKALGGTTPPAKVVTASPLPKTVTPQAAPAVPLPPAAKLATASPPPPIRRAGFSEGKDQAPRPASDSPGGQQVQLGAWRSEAEATAGWEQAVKKAGGALSGFSPHIVAVDLPGKGHFYRLRVETAEGKQLCTSLTQKGVDCAVPKISSPGPDTAKPSRPRMADSGRPGPDAKQVSKSGETQKTANAP
ncbi:MAG TPA: tetratricopeptide repeat protein [Rhizomicrobium sp.]|nr:tetratricopeptide repeat protein [Rhizomicrobium sp.]